MDHARGRVAATERSLRTAQHKDTLEVEEFGFEQAVADERGVVEADRDRGVVRRGNRLGPDAANVEVITAEIALREIDVGHRAHQLGAALDLVVVERLGRDGADRDRPVADLFRSEEHTSELQPLMRISYA